MLMKLPGHTLFHVLFLMPLGLLLFSCSSSSELRQTDWGSQKLSIACDTAEVQLTPDRWIHLTWRDNTGMTQKPFAQDTDMDGQPTNIYDTFVRVMEVTPNHIVVSSNDWYHRLSVVPQNGEIVDLEAPQFSDFQYGLRIPLERIQDIALLPGDAEPVSPRNSNNKYPGILPLDMLLGGMAGVIVVGAGTLVDRDPKDHIFTDDETPSDGFLFLAAAIGAVTYPLIRYLGRDKEYEGSNFEALLEEAVKYELKDGTCSFNVYAAGAKTF